MESAKEFEARLRKGHEFAPSLVGLDERTAVQQVLARGYRPEVVPPTVDAVTADLNSHRIRLYVDENDRVIRARAG